MLSATQIPNIKAVEIHKNSHEIFFRSSSSSSSTILRFTGRKLYGFSFVYSLIVIIHIFKGAFYRQLFHYAKTVVYCAPLLRHLVNIFSFYYWTIDIRWFVLSVRFCLSYEIGVAIFKIIFLLVRSGHSC